MLAPYRRWKRWENKKGSFCVVAKEFGIRPPQDGQTHGGWPSPGSLIIGALYWIDKPSKECLPGNAAPLQPCRISFTYTQQLGGFASDSKEGTPCPAGSIWKVKRKVKPRLVAYPSKRRRPSQEAGAAGAVKLTQATHPRQRWPRDPLFWRRCSCKDVWDSVGETLVTVIFTWCRLISRLPDAVDVVCFDGLIFRMPNAKCQWKVKIYISETKNDGPWKRWLL